jgi:hypothetical protein
VPQPEQDEVISIVESTKEGIVTTPPLREEPEEPQEP